MIDGFYYNDTGSANGSGSIEITADLVQVTGSLNVQTFGVTGSLAGTASGNISSASFTDGELLLYYGDQITSASVNFASGTFEATASQALTASYYLETQNLQDVTTIGNVTSASVILSGSNDGTYGNTNLYVDGVFVQGYYSDINTFGTANEAYNGSHAEGQQTTAAGDYSHAEGVVTTALGGWSHAEGQSTIAAGASSHAEGDISISFGDFSHAEGSATQANGNYSHAEGSQTQANGPGSHAEGLETTTIGNGSHAEGYLTTTKTAGSHAEGLGTITNKAYQHVEGQYNAEDTEALWIVGGGTGDLNRKNVISAYTSSISITGSIFKVTSSTFFGVQTLPDVNDTGSTFFVTYNTASGQFHYLNANPPFVFQGYNGGFDRFEVISNVIGGDGVIPVGQYTQYGTTPVGRISVLDLKGNLSTSPMNVGSGFNRNLGGITTTNGNDGYIVSIASGGAPSTSYKGVTIPTNINGPFRLTVTGDIDNTWNSGGTGIGVPVVYEVYKNPTGGYLFAHNFNTGVTTTYNGTTVGTVVALNNDGTLNTTLQTELNNRYTAGYFNANKPTRAIPCPDGKIIAICNNNDGTTWSIGKRIILLNANGTIDTTFDTGAGTGPNSNASYVAVVQTGSAATDYFFLITGFNGTPGFNPGMTANLTSWNGTAVQDIFAVDRNGTIRSSFNQMNYVPAISANLGRVFDPVKFVQVNNYLYAYGNFTSIAGQTVGSMARFNLSGSFDAAFNPGGAGAVLNDTQYNSTINTVIKHDTREELWVAGGILSWNGVATLSTGNASVVRMNYNGQVVT